MISVNCLIDGHLTHKNDVKKYKATPTGDVGDPDCGCKPDLSIPKCMKVYKPDKSTVVWISIL